MRAVNVAGVAALAWSALAGAGMTQADCSGAANQVEAGFCAKAGWEASDAELNRLWKQVKPAADRAGRGEVLLNAQRAWLKIRDATCAAERAQFAGGSIEAQVYWSCMDRLTRQRNAELRAF